MAGYTKITAPQVPCPKCYGAKSFAPYSHIAGGICFRCGGAGTVDESKLKPETTAPQTPATPSRWVELPGFPGKTQIVREKQQAHDAPGGFRAYFPDKVDEDGHRDPGSGGIVYFDVENGRIVNVTVTNGIGRRRGEAIAALQGALKVPARRNPRARKRRP